MRIKILTVIVLAMFISGCATTKNNNNIEIQQLKGRVAGLETDLQARKQEIARLEGELEKSHEKRPVLKEERAKEVKQDEPKILSTRQIQAALKKAGFYKGSVDGKMGPATLDALKAFQRSNGQKADGVAGRKTRAILTRYLSGGSKK